MSSGRSYGDAGQTPISGARPSERVYGTDCGLRSTDATESALPGETIYGADVGQKASSGYHHDAKDRASRGFQDMQSEETQRLDESRFEPSKGHNEANAESPSITERLRDQASHLYHSAKEYATGAVDSVKHKAGEVKDKFSSGNHQEGEHNTDSTTTFVDQSRYDAGKENKLPQTESHTVGEKLHGQATDLYDSAKDTFQRQWDSGSQRTDAVGTQQAGAFGTQHSGDTGMHQTGNSGMYQAGTTGMLHSGNTGNTGLHQTGTTGMHHTGTTGMQQGGNTGMHPTGTTGMQQGGNTGMHQTGNTGMQQSGTVGESKYEINSRSNINDNNNNNLNKDSNRDSRSVTEKVRDKASDMYHSAKDTAQEKWTEGKERLSGNTDNKDSGHRVGLTHDTTYRGAGIGTYDPAPKPGRQQDTTATHGSGADRHDTAFKMGGHRDSNKDKLAHESGLKKTDNIMLAGQTKADETRGG